MHVSSWNCCLGEARHRGRAAKEGARPARGRAAGQGCRPCHRRVSSSRRPGGGALHQQIAAARPRTMYEEGQCGHEHHCVQRRRGEGRRTPASRSAAACTASAARCFARFSRIACGAWGEQRGVNQPALSGLSAARSPAAATDCRPLCRAATDPFPRLHIGLPRRRRVRGGSCGGRGGGRHKGLPSVSVRHRRHPRR